MLNIMNYTPELVKASQSYSCPYPPRFRQRSKSEQHNYDVVKYANAGYLPAEFWYGLWAG